MKCRCCGDRQIDYNYVTLGKIHFCGPVCKSRYIKDRYYLWKTQVIKQL